MILRSHIHKALSQYYQQPHNRVVGSIQSKSVNFRSLLGEWHWRRVFSKLYKDQSGQWLTPVELFRPYYSQIIANFIASQAGFVRGADKIDIVEIGGGRGTNAFYILNHLREEHPDVFDCVNYTIMDASPTLLDLQRKTLLSGDPQSGIQGNPQNEEIINFKEIDMLDVAERKVNLMSRSDDCTIVLGMELLDNLPHDKLSICSKTGEILQTNLDIDKETGNIKEVGTILEDTLLQEMIDVQPSYIPTTGSKWVPTVATSLFKRIFEQRPNASAVFADFDYLPDTMSHRAEGEPLVTDMEDIDHESYLTAPELCDILFPTDFDSLQGYVSAIMEETISQRNDVRSWNVNVQKQNQFLFSYGMKEVQKTKSRFTGYSPLVEDFSNCSVLTVSRSENNFDLQ